MTGKSDRFKSPTQWEHRHTLCNSPPHGATYILHTMSHSLNHGRVRTTRTTGRVLSTIMRNTLWSKSLPTSRCGINGNTWSSGRDGPTQTLHGSRRNTWWTQLHWMITNLSAQKRQQQHNQPDAVRGENNTKPPYPPNDYPPTQIQRLSLTTRQHIAETAQQAARGRRRRLRLSSGTHG